MVHLGQLELQVHEEQLERVVPLVLRGRLALLVQPDCEVALELLEMSAIQGQLELLVLLEFLVRQAGLALKAALARVVFRAQQVQLGLQGRQVILAPLAQ